MHRLSSMLLLAGVGICALGIVGLVGGMWVNLPPEAVRRIAMALPFVVGGLLLTVGALVGRAARRVRLPPSDADVRQLDAGTPAWTVLPGEEANTRRAPRRDG